MTVRFKTENGSLYILDDVKMTWERSPSDKSGRIRAERGTLMAWPTLSVGVPAALWDSNTMPGADMHIVLTSRVTEIIRYEVADDLAAQQVIEAAKDFEIPYTAEENENG